MVLETITREEFDKRLDASNVQRAEELRQIEEKQTKVEQLLSHYEHTLDGIESELENMGGSRPSHSPLQKRLRELAEKTLAVAASV